MRNHMTVNVDRLWVITIFMKKLSKNVLSLLTLFIAFMVVTQVQAATWVFAPDVNFYMDPVNLRVPLTDQAQAYKTDVEKAFAADGTRSRHAGFSGITEPTYAKSLLSGLPQGFWGNYVDWRNVQYALKGMNYLIEVAGFDPQNTGIAMIQDGYGVTSGFHQTFRIYFPAVLKDNVVNIIIDREYLEAIGVAPETVRLIWFTNQTKTSWTGKEPFLHPYPVETSIVTVTAIADCGCDHDNRGQTDKKNDLENDNKEKCKQKIGTGASSK
mgnify:CR=1 FL=1